MRVVSTLIVLLASWAGTSLGAQVPPTDVATAPAESIGGNLGRVVADVEQAARFYRDVLGLKVSMPSLVTPPWNEAKVPGAFVELPGANWSLELVQAPTGATSRQIQVQDRGALTLVLNVENIEAILERAAKAEVPVVSTGGGLVAVAGRGGINKATLIQGPDGEFMELLEPWREQAVEPEAAGPGSVTLLRAVRVTVRDADEAAAMYGRLLSVEFGGGPRPVSDPGVQFMVGLPAKKFQVRIARRGLAGSGMTFEAFAVVDLAGNLEPLPLRSPGATYLRLSAPTDIRSQFTRSSEVANLHLVPLVKQ